MADEAPEIEMLMIPLCPDRPGDTRYPYTYAADFIRMAAGSNEQGVILSRSEASQIREAVALALGMDDALLAKILAIYFLSIEPALTETVVRKAVIAKGGL